MGFFGIFWIILFVAVLGWLFPRVKRQDTSTGEDGRDNAMEILKQRYARGEVSKEEYEERKRTLNE